MSTLCIPLCFVLPFTVLLVLNGSHTIVFSLFYIAQHHKLKMYLQRALQSVHVQQDLTSDKEKLKKWKTFSRGKREETFRRATEADPSPRIDGSNRCHVYRRKHYRVT